MKEFFMHLLGYVAIAFMIGSVAYTWAKINYELKQMEKAK